MKKILPHLVALIVFAVVSALFFAPQYSGKVLNQSDIIQATGMSADINEHIEMYGEHPQWSGRDFGGMPAYLINMNYEGRYVKELSSFFYFLGQPAAFLWVAMVAFYLMLCLMGVSPWIAMVGGLGYGLSAYFPQIIVAGHITKMMAIAWAPALVGSVWYAYRRNRWLGGALAGIFAAIEISTSHPQITYYFLFVILAIFVNEFIRASKERKYRDFTLTSVVLLSAAVLAVGANSVQLYYVMDHTPETTRGISELKQVKEKHPDGGLEQDYAMQWSYGKMETFNLFIPNFKGQGSSSGFSEDGQVVSALRKYDVPAVKFAQQLPSYWGTQPFTMGPMYIGALLIFLALFAVFVLSPGQWVWIAVPSLFAMILAWGNNFEGFNTAMFKYLPLYNKFRTPSMALVVMEWAVPVLACLGLSKVFSGSVSKEKLKKALIWSLSILGLLAFISAFIFTSLFDFVGLADEYAGLPNDILQAMRSERASMLRSDALRSLFLIVLGAGFVLLLYYKKMKAELLFAALAAVVMVDLWTVDNRMVGWDNFVKEVKQDNIKLTDADKMILQDTTNYRVANMTVNPFADATTSFHHRSVGGYHAAKLRRYQDLIDRYLSKSDMGVYNMLNTKYFITEKGVAQNDDAAGNAWFVSDVEWVDGADEELDALAGFSTERAVIDTRFRDQVSVASRDSLATISLVDYRVNRLTYSSHSSEEGIAVFSEIYYPKGWTVTIDGQPSEYYRANYVLRAMNIPSGDHTIVWSFKAPHFSIMVFVTAVSSIILLLGAAVSIFFSVKKRMAV